MHWALGKFFIRKVIGWKLPVKEICGRSRVQVRWELDGHGAETVRKPSKELGAAEKGREHGAPSGPGGEWPDLITWANLINGNK